ncbi:hypothetical protein [Sphingomonas sp.]|uniref:hypothetical protein n=1 Tax=Sphingomonas sp. TaxID=28214 RepID=UPI002DD697CF|nr:hypothetical protein [Sphingomonas sp.]
MTRMIRTNLFLAPAILVMTALTSACGQGAAEAETENAAETLSEAAASNGANVGDAAPAAAVETAPASAPAPTAETVAALPLKHGHYVNSDSPCNQASNADMAALVTPTGLSLNCTYKKIEKTGTTYRVTSECSDGGAAWGREEGIETRTDTYEIPNETSFKVTYDGGSERSARYCAPSSLPASFGF